MTCDRDTPNKGIHPIVALRDFILDEKSALYPRTLIVGDIEEDGMTYRGWIKSEDRIADSELTKIVAQLRDRLLPKVLEVTRALQLDIGDETWVPNWASKIVSGNREAATCLLIALLPNLEKLRIFADGRYNASPPFYSLLGRLLEGATDSKYDLTGLNSFKYLSEVGLEGGDDGSGEDFDVGPLFSALPSIRTIKGRYMEGSFEMPGQVHKPETSAGPKSEITSLEFRESTIDPDSFSKCIANIKSLQKFIYDFCADIDFGDPYWEPRGIVGVLKAFASRSLVHLELTGITDIDHVKLRRGEPFIGSLRAFEVLETLILETVTLYKEVEGTDDRTPNEKSESNQIGAPETNEHDLSGGRNTWEEPERLVDVLPASARRLRLLGELSDEDAIAMLAGIEELKDKRIPNLESISFEDVETSSEILSICEGVSVQATFCEWL